MVTGAAGFIGSATASLLLAQGCAVRGIDALTDTYSPALKQANLAPLRDWPRFQFIHADLEPGLCDTYFADAVAVIHLAGEGGVRPSWTAFDTYLARNVLATKTVLGAALRAAVPRVVYASSSSVYGNTTRAQVDERSPTRPVSPYGVTKLAGERLAVAYGLETGLATACLRYFTVYGPAQRPDMAIHRLIATACGAGSFRLLGDGRQTRDFTYVGDVAVANALAALSPGLDPGTVLNVCSETPVALNDVITEIGSLTGRPPTVEHARASAGDVARTSGSAARIRTLLGWEPRTALTEGLQLQLDHHLARTAPVLAA